MIGTVFGVIQDDLLEQPYFIFLLISYSISVSWCVRVYISHVREKESEICRPSGRHFSSSRFLRIFY